MQWCCEAGGITILYPIIAGLVFFARHDPDSIAGEVSMVKRGGRPESY